MRDWKASRPRLSKAAGAWRDTSGTVAVMAGLMCVPMFGIGALVIDVGLAFTQQTRLRAGADAAALAAVLKLGSASDVAAASLTSNNWPVGTATAVTTGIYCPDPGVAVASRYTAGGTRCASNGYTANLAGVNAVRVSATATSPIGLGQVLATRANFTISASATATRIDMAGFSAGTGLASLNGGDLNGLLSTLFGANVNLSAASYNGLLNANIDALSFLKALAVNAGLSAGTFGSLAGASVTTGQVLAAAATALNQPDSTSNSAAAAALASLTSALPANATIPVSSLVNLQPYLNDQVLAPGPAALQAGLNAYGLVSALGQIVGAGKTVAVPTGSTPIALGASVGGVASLSVSGIVIQPPASPIFAFGPVGTTVTTSQVSMGITITVQNPSLSAFPLLGLAGLTNVQITIPLYVNLAGGTATLTAINCMPGTPTMTVTGSTNPATVALGTASGPATPARPVTLLTASLLGVGLISISGSGTAVSEASTPQSVTFTKAQTEQTPPVVMTVSSNASLFNSAASGVASGISFQSSGLLGILAAPLTGLISADILAELLVADLPVDGVLNQVLNGLGLRVGYMDITGNGIRCGVPVLVQ